MLLARKRVVVHRIFILYFVAFFSMKCQLSLSLPFFNWTAILCLHKFYALGWVEKCRAKDKRQTTGEGVGNCWRLLKSTAEQFVFGLSHVVFLSPQLLLLFLATDWVNCIAIFGPGENTQTTRVLWIELFSDCSLSSDSRCGLESTLSWQAALSGGVVKGQFGNRLVISGAA